MGNQIEYTIFWNTVSEFGNVRKKKKKKKFTEMDTLRHYEKKNHKTGLRSEYFKSVLYLPMYFVHST